MDLLGAIELFLEVRAGENLSSATLSWYARQLAAFADYAGDVEVAAVRSLVISRFLAREAKRLRPASVDARYRALLAFFSWCAGRDEVGRPASPMGIPGSRTVKRPRREVRIIQHVTYAEYKQIVDAIDLATWLDLRDFALISTLFWCGLRAAECAALHVSDVDIGRRLLTVRVGKGRKARLVPMSEELTAGLLSYLAALPRKLPQLWLKSDWLTPLEVCGVLSQAGIKEVLRRRCPAAGVRYRNPHSWRHGFAMTFLHAGLEMSAVAALMGHASVKTTERTYARWLVSGLQRAYQVAATMVSTTTTVDLME